MRTDASRHEIGPAPLGAELQIDVECTTAPHNTTGAAHRVVIRTDWSTMTPDHVLEAERVARALGGWVGCLSLVEQALPPFHHRLVAMSDPTATIGRSPDGWWLNTRQASCTGGHHAHRTLAAAMRHEVSLEHAAAATGTHPAIASETHAVAWGYALVIDATARDAWFTTAIPELVVGGLDGYRHLWRLGVLPDQATAVARDLPRRAWPAPPDYLAHLHFRALERRPWWLR